MPQYRRCWVPNCRNSKAKWNRRPQVFSFPSDPERCVKWLKAIGDPTLASCSWNLLTRRRYVCVEHFTPKMLSAANRAAYNAEPVLFADVRPELPEGVLRSFLEGVPQEKLPVPPDLEDHSPVADTYEDNNEFDSFLGEKDVEDHSPVADTYEDNNEFNSFLVSDPPHPQYQDPSTIENSPVADIHKDTNEIVSFVDSAPIDHDYFVTTVPTKQQDSGYVQNQHFCNDDQEDLLAKQQTLENLRRQLCRLCGQRGPVLKPLFETASSTFTDLPTASKIDMYLPIKVKLDDSLPFCICFNCLTVLNQWHELYTTCVAADGVLSKTFGKESHMTCVNNPCTSKVRQNAETQTEDMPSESLTDEAKEKEDVCTHCGESKTGILREDKLFKEEFDKSFCNYGRTLHKCRFCYELFRNSAERKSHMAMCRQLSTICELCGHKVPCRKNLKKHKYERHNVSRRKYLCDKCYKFCATASGLKLHLERIHGAEDHSGKYCCELCGGLFTRKIYYHMHKKKHEMGKVKTVFKIENFRQEVNSEDSENGVIYACPVCQEKFNDMHSLVFHLVEKKKLKCSSCRKVVYSEKSIYLHVCGQWTCQYCSKSFDQRVKWLIHERGHTGEKPVKCRKCDKTFRKWQTRNAHEARHEPMPHVCTYCGKRFRKKSVFRDHVLHHEGKEFLCHICNKNFSGRESLYKHRNRAHHHKGLKRAVCSNE